MVLLRCSLPRSLRSTPFLHVQSRAKSTSTSSTISPLYPTSSTYTYSLGLSYASKYSPPFIPANQKIPPYGFMSRDKEDGITKWVNEMMDFPAGRGELTSGQDGGWTEEVRKGVRKWGAGEDFFGIQRVGNDVHLSLSDGVGGWTDRVDPSLFSQALCYHYSTIASQFNSSDPVEILDKAYRQLLDDKRVIAGGATLVGVRLGEEGDASFVNLGDSGYAIMRNDQTKYISRPQTHFFNCPLQLSKIPKDMRQAGIIHDQPSMADLQDFQLETGDVVILFTDGLSDNLPTTHLPLLSSSLTQLLNSPLNSHLTQSERDAEFARLFSDILVGYGRMAMARTGDEKGWKTPFEVEATREVPQNGWRGGKVDDITVMTAVVSESD